MSDGAVPPVSAPIRVGFNARYLRENNLRGFNRYTISLLAELQKKQDIHLILFTDHRSPIHPDFTKRINAEIVNVPARSVLLWEQVALPSALRRHRVDVFHAPADAGIPARRACPTVLTYHHAADKSLKYEMERSGLPGRIGDYVESESGLRGWYSKLRHDVLRRLYLQRANRVITVSQFGKWELVSLLKVPEAKVDAIYEAPDCRFTPDVLPSAIGQVKSKYGLPEKYMLFVGGFDLRKNVGGLIKAFAEAKRSGISEALAIVGTGSGQNSMQEMLPSLGLQHGRDVFFLGGVQDDELPALYCGSIALVTLSWGESFCFPLVEAMSCGTPVIASTLGAIPEVAGGACTLVDPRNTSDAARAMTMVATQPRLRKELREAGLRRASLFSWQQTAERTVNVYRSVISAGRSA